ncbi:MAG: hypothetical protein PHG19_04080 [Anaerotignum sp.]|nr:hypothetical protein [Anaerotignum sp.]
MATYNNPFDKAAAFWNVFHSKLKATGGSQAFWDEVMSMGIYFDKNDTEAKIFVLLVDELERYGKEIDHGTRQKAKD